LLLRAATTLHQAGATTIRTDVDTGNLPMANAFRRTGYRQFATRREYTIDLEDA
jgi:RimJ/RimL family protein N-acetyltransferase